MLQVQISDTRGQMSDVRHQISEVKNQIRNPRSEIRDPKSGHGFSLIELLIAVSIIALITSVGLVAYSKAQQASRDSRRKEDLNAINSALGLYYADQRVFPPTATFLCSDTENWIPALTAGNYLSRVPIDPVNRGTFPWINSNYKYCYGNVSADGQTYDLVAQLENKNDPDRCGMRGWKSQGGTVAWCPGEPPNSFGGSQSNYLYSASPTR